MRTHNSIRCAPAASTDTPALFRKPYRIVWNAQIGRHEQRDDLPVARPRK